MLRQQSQNTHKTNDETFSILEFPNEILLKIFLYLNKPDIRSLILTCKYFNGLIDSDYFWKEHLPAIFNSERIKTINNSQYKLAGKNFYSLPRSFFNSLDNNRVGFWIFKSEDIARIFNKSFDMNKVYKAIFNDNEQDFIQLVSRFPEDITYQGVFDHASFSAYITPLRNIRNINIQFGDFSFIGKLLPSILRAQAINCFKLCMNLFFTMVNFTRVRYANDDDEFIKFLKSHDNVNYDIVEKEIFKSENQYFIKEFINYTLCHFPVEGTNETNKSDLYFLNLIAKVLKNHEKFILESMKQLNPERKEKLITFFKQHLKKIRSEDTQNKLMDVLLNCQKEDQPANILSLRSNS